LVVAVVFVVALVALPWDRWFAGTLIRAEAGTFVERHAAMIGFIGLVLSLAAFGPIVSRLVSRARTQETTSE
jgi:hypothetical protein